MGSLRDIPVFLEAIKVSHSVFALPYAIAAAFMAAGGMPPLPVAGKIVLACVFARTAAMSFNRWIDARWDALNPRTRGRAVPAGRLSRRFMAVATLLSSLAFVLTALWIHRLAFLLSPVALTVLLGYSYTKRFTSLSHLVLGLALGLSPVGAWLAVREEVGLPAVILAAAVLCWTAGFDILYSCQDVRFDRSHRLRSIPARIGVAWALRVARLAHVATVALLATVGIHSGYSWPYAAGVAAVAALLVGEHALVSASDLSRLDVAFFTMNGLVSLLFMASVILQVVIS